MSDSILTKNFLPLLFSPDCITKANPVIQILATETVNIALNDWDEPQPRRRALVSDGKFFCQAMLPDYVEVLDEIGDGGQYLVYTLRDYEVDETVPGRKLLIILDAQIYPHPRVQIGEPTLNLEAPISDQDVSPRKRASKPKPDPSTLISRGFIRRMWSSKGPPEGYQPVLQCLGVDKYQVSTHWCPCTGSMCALVESKEVDVNTMMKLQRFACRDLPGGTKVVVVASAYPIYYIGGKIGTPTDIDAPQPPPPAAA